MFYDNLKAECDRQNLKITSIVVECGGASGSINGWKKGAMPNSSIVLALAMRLNVSTDYLLMGKECSNVSHPTVGAVGNHSNGIVTINNGTVNSDSQKKKNNTSNSIDNLDGEALKIFRRLPTKEKFKLLAMMCEFEEEYMKQCDE